MKLTYFVDAHGNFGDDLNEWVWDREAPGFIDENANTALLGIGTLLGDWFLKDIPAGRHKVSIGTGAGKGSIPALGPDWSLYGVRGPLTAAYLGLDQSKIAADPAVLINSWEDLYPHSSRDDVGFMPHVWSARIFDWRPICRDLGLVYIDPEADSIKTVSAIGKLGKLVTEAMHGAIVADAARVPWVATRISSRFDAGKWSDWGASVGVDVKFHHLPELRRDSRDFVGVLKGRAKRLLAAYGAPVSNVYSPASSRITKVEARIMLQHLARNTPVQLSPIASLRSAIERVKNALDSAQNDKARGLI